MTRSENRMPNHKILIIEDDTTLAGGLCRALSSDTCGTESCGNLRKARAILSESCFDLILLDINLPDGSGLDFLKEIKDKSSVPVIMLTANDMEADVVVGLEAGADDYVTKPFSLAVLRARVHAQLRKHASAIEPHPVQTGRYTFDFERMEFSYGNMFVELSKTEQKLLRILVENRGSTLKRSYLIDRVWTDGAEYVDENTLSVTVKRLRDKLNAQDIIRTVYGIGYEWRE